MDQTLLKIGSAVVFLAACTMLGHAYMVQRNDERLVTNSGESVPSRRDDASVAARSRQELRIEFGKFAGGESSRANGRDRRSGDTLDENNDTRLVGYDAQQSPRLQPLVRVGRIGDVPRLRDVRSLETLPRTAGELLRAYRDAGDRGCQLLSEGVATEAPLSVTRDGHGRLGRIGAVTIGLELADEGRNKLPKIALNQVLQYFRNHRLAVQPVVYHDDQGRFYFGNECKAAFYSMQRSGSTMTPEPMIESAVARFRVLGLMASTEFGPAGSSEKGSGRTLVLAFAFEQADDLLTGGTGRRQIHEMMFLHLPVDFAPERPRLDVFITRNEGQDLHRLNTGSLDLGSGTASITAEVRFDKTVLLGLYPAEPVVTDIQFGSGGSIPMAALASKIRPRKTGDQQSSADVLDAFDSLASDSGGEQKAADPAESWLDQLRREKEGQFQATFGDR